MLIALKIISAVLFFFIGASVFSFLNVVSFRMQRGISFVKGRSKCFACGKTLSAIELIPGFSWFLLRGRCRGCGEKFSPRDSLLELLGGALAVLSVAVYGISFKALLVFAFICFTELTAIYDADTMEIPYGFVVCTAVTAVGSYFAFPDIGIVSRVIGTVCIALPLFLLTLLIKNAFGGGDILFIAAIGAFLGWKLTLFAFYIAMITGGITGIVLLLTKKLGKKDVFPFAPFISLGAVATVLAAEPISIYIDGLIETFSTLFA